MSHWKSSLVLAVTAVALACAPPSARAQPERKPFRALDRAPLAHPANADQSAAEAVDTSDYVGADTCKACHEEVYNNWEKTPHWKTLNDSRGGPSKQGCEGCHGPGAAHVAGGGDVSKIFTFKNASVQEVNSRCLGCHAGGPQHMNAVNSVHTENGVSCISCHSPHHAETKEYLLSKSQPELCFGCHETISLFWIHPLAFLGFFVIGGALLVLGVLLYLYSIVFHPAAKIPGDSAPR